MQATFMCNTRHNLNHSLKMVDCKLLKKLRSRCIFYPRYQFIKWAIHYMLCFFYHSFLMALRNCFPVVPLPSPNTNNASCGNKHHKGKGCEFRIMNLWQKSSNKIHYTVTNSHLFLCRRLIYPEINLGKLVLPPWGFKLDFIWIETHTMKFLMKYIPFIIHKQYHKSLEYFVV